MQFAALLFLAFLLCGCSPQPEVGSPPAGADSQMSDGNSSCDVDAATADADVHVIDVRTEEEWNSGHVQQAVLIPHTEIAERIGEVTTDKDAKIVLYCAVGGRAGKAKDSLEELGYTNVENAGGYDDVKDRFQ